MSAKPSKKLTAKDYETLGRRLENIYLTGYIDRKEMLKMSFVKGVMTGFGGVVGATIVVALLLWILSFFNTVPLLGPVLENVEQSVQTQQQ